MSQQLQLLAIARHLASLIDTQITSSPGEPQLILQALKLLIPQAEDFFTQVEELPNEEDQWNHLINFIETQLFDEGMNFGFDKLDTQEIIEVYKVVVQMIEEAVEQQDENEEERDNQNDEQQQGFQQRNHSQQHPQRSLSQQQQPAQLQNHNQDGQTDSQNNTASSGGSQSSNQQMHAVENLSAQPVQNQQSLNYLQNVRKQQHQKKKEVQIKKLKPSQKQQHIQFNVQQQQLLPKGNKTSKQPKIQKSASAISKPDKKTNKQALQKHTKSILKQSKQDNDKNRLKQISQKHHKSQNEQKLQKKKKQGPKTALKYNNQPHQKSVIQFNKRKTSQLQQNKQQKPSKSQRHKKQVNLVNQPLQQVVIKTMKQVMKKRQKPITKSQLKSNPLIRDNYVTEMMQQAARTYNYEVKSHKTQQKLHQKTQKSTLNHNQNDSRKDKSLKILKQKQKDMQSQVLNSQLQYYYKLRDKKVGYIKHMHKLMERLEKERQIDLHKKQAEITKQEKQKIRKKIQQADNLFQQNIKDIKESYQQQRKKKRVNNDEQIKVLSEMEKNLVKNKEDEINMMKCLWEQERMKLDLIAKDEERVKGKLEHMYRKTKV